MKRGFLSVVFMFLALMGRSQRYLGVATSDWSAINRVYLNPAGIAACKEKISVSMFSFSIAVDNDLGRLPAFPDLPGTVDGDNNIFTRTKKGAFNMIVPDAALRGPGIMASLSPKISIAFTTGIRGMNQFHNFDPALYTAIANPQKALADTYSIRMRDFNWTAHMWSEIGFTFAAVVREGDRYSLSLGGTLRRLGGIGYVAMRGKNLDVGFRGGTDFYAENTNVDFSSNVLNDSVLVFKDMSPRGLVRKFFEETSGASVGGDIGFTVKYKIGEPDPSDYMESNLTHDIVFSAAVTDIGAITYYNTTSASVKIKGQGTLTGQGIADNATNIRSLIDYAHKQGFSTDTEAISRTVFLPTSLVLSTDVQVHGRFFLNLLYIGNMANRLNFTNSYYGQLTLTPRYDYHKMTVALPVTYSRLTHNLKVGCAFRYTGFFIGSDDVLAVRSKCQYGFNIYLGACIPVLKRKHDPSGLHWGR